MAVPFPQTMRSLAADRGHGTVIALGFAVLGFSGWLVWFLFAEVGVQVVAPQLEIQVQASSHEIDSPASGRLSALHVRRGDHVDAGELLAELDTSVQREQLGEARTRLAGVGPRIEALEKEIGALDATLDAERTEAGVKAAQSAAKRDEGKLRAELASDRAERDQAMAEAGALAEVERLESLSEAEQQRLAEKALELEVGRVQAEHASRETRTERDLQSLRRTLVEHENLRAETLAQIEVLEAEIEQRRVHAPIGGVIGELGDLNVGSFVDLGDLVAVIVPPSELLAVAHVPAADGMGRIEPGQPARLRLSAFPWAEYGTVSATVREVAAEAQNGMVRVGLDVEEHDRIRLQHGLVGTAEIDVERISPAIMVLRSIGKAVSASSGAEAAPEAGTGPVAGPLP